MTAVGGHRRVAYPRALGLLAWAFIVSPAAIADCAEFHIDGDAIHAPLAGRQGDAAAGARVAVDRRRGDCVICHQLPRETASPSADWPERRFHGNLGPPLDAVGARLSPGQLRLRIAAGRILMPESIMPNYCLTQGRHGVAEAWRGQPLLDAQEIEDLVAWLAGLDGRQQDRAHAGEAGPASHAETGS